MEIGFGRGYGIYLVLQKILDGKGAIFGIERSKEMINHAETFILQYDDRFAGKVSLRHVIFC